MLYWSSSYCIMTSMIIVYQMVVLHCAYCTCTVICGQFTFYLGSQSVSCKAPLATLRLYGYFCDFCFVFVSENKYDDDVDDASVTAVLVYSWSRHGTS